MPDNNNTFNLFADLSDSEIERFLMDSADTNLETLEIVDEERAENGDDLTMYDDLLIDDDLRIDDNVELYDDARNQESSLISDNNVDKNRLTTLSSEPSSQLSSEKKPQNVEEIQKEIVLKNVVVDNDIDVATTAATPIKSELDHKIDTIKDSMHAFKKQLKTIATLSDSFHDTSSQMMEAIRDLENHGDDDFSITYEQAYQLRGCLLAARRAFNEVPNFYDLVEQAWEYDLYTAQMRPNQALEE